MVDHKLYSVEKYLKIKLILNINFFMIQILYIQYYVFVKLIKLILIQLTINTFAFGKMVSIVVHYKIFFMKTSEKNFSHNTRNIKFRKD